MRKIYANLKSVLAAVAMVAMLGTAVLSASCSAEYDDTQIKNQLNQLTQRVDALESDFEALQSILSEGVLSAEQDADGNWVITTPDGTVEITVEGANEGTITIVEQDGAQYWAVIESGNPVVVAPVMEKPEFRSNPATGMAEISFDGNTWYAMGGALISNIAVKDNTLVLTIGGYDVVVPMAEEIVFDIRSGMVAFSSLETKSVVVKTQGIEDLAVLATPKGWYAEIDGNQLVVTAPNYGDTIDVTEFDWDTYQEVVISKASAAAEGYVKVHANTADGKCLVGKVKVSMAGASVQVYDNMAYFTAPYVESYGTWKPRQFFYGIATRDAFVEQVEAAFPLIEHAKYEELPAGVFYTSYDENWELPESVKVSVAEMLGAEPEVGVEYVVWAFYENYGLENCYSVENVSYVYYSPVAVTVTEDESKRSAYNVEITVEVAGTDQYLALAVPGNYMDDYETEEEKLEAMQSQAVSLAYQYAYPSSWGSQGKIYSESYTGSLLDICAGTTSSMSGMYEPGMDVFLFIMPIDDRPVEMYVTEDPNTGEMTTSSVYSFCFKTAELQPGGVVNAALESVTTYIGKGQDENYNTIDKEFTVNPMSEAAVKVTPTDTENWHSFYYAWLSPAQLAELGTDEKIAEYLLDTYGVLKEDFVSEGNKFPYYIVNKELTPEAEATLVLLFIDQDLKYGEVARCTVKTEGIQYSTVELTATANLEAVLDTNILKNTTTLEITPSTEGIVKYAYVFGESWYFDTYDASWNSVPMSDEEILTKLLLGQQISWSTPTQEIAVSDLVDGKIVISDLEFNSDYCVAVIGYDAEGKPTTGNFCERFTVKLQIDELKADGYEAVAPEVNYTITPNSNTFKLVVNVKPVEGTKIGIFVGDPTPNGYSFPMEASDIAKVEDLFGSTTYTRYRLPISDSYYWVLDEEGYYSYTDSYWDYDDPMAIVYAVCDAEGNYYAPVTIDLSDTKFQQEATVAHYAGNMQWLVSKEDMEASLMQVPAPGVIDLGVSTPSTMYVGYDLGAANPEDPTAAGLWDIVVPQPYSFEIGDYENFAVTDDYNAYKSFSVTINILSTDNFGDTTKVPVTLTVDEGGNDGAGLYTLDMTNLGFWEEAIEVQTGPYYPIEFETLKSMAGGGVGGGAL